MFVIKKRKLFMKIELNIEKKRFWALFTSLLVLSIIVVVYALPTGVNFGHDAKDIYVDGTVLKQYIQQNSISLGKYSHKDACFTGDTAVAWRTENKICAGSEDYSINRGGRKLPCTGATTVTAVGTTTWSTNKPTAQSETYINEGHRVVENPDETVWFCTTSTAICTTPTYVLCSPNGY